MRFSWAFLAAVALVVAAGPAAAQDVRLAGKPSGPICGGIVNGKLQPECTSALPGRAIYEGAAVKACAPGQIADLDQCWTCVEDATKDRGFERSPAAITTDRACHRRNASIRGEFGPARLIKNVACGRGPAHNESFWDGIDGGTCWKCPNGFGRTWEHIGHEKACSQGVFGPFAHATLEKKNHCEPGETHDPRNGGECWKCPEAWDRTVFPVTGGQACEKGGGWEFKKAMAVGPLGCAAGQHWDPINLTNAELAQLKLQKLVAKPDAKPTDTGPTCWSCRTGYKRSTGHVKENGACLGFGMEWYTAPYPEPGLFGLPGATEVAVELVKQRTGIDAAIAEIAQKTGTKLEDARKAFWEEIEQEPEDSPVLKTVVLAAILAATEDPSRATPAQKQLATSFAAYIPKRRTYVAEDAIALYHNWKESTDLRRARSQQGTLVAAADGGTVPPDFAEIGEAGLIAAMATGGALSTSYSITMAMPAVHKAVFPFARKTAMKALGRAQLKVMDKVGETAIRKVSQKAMQEGTKAVAKSLQKLAGALKAIGSIGPQIIITAAVEMIIAMAERQIDIATALPKLMVNLETAKLPVDLNRMIDSDQGYGEITGFWSLATSVNYKPSPFVTFEIARAASVALGKTPSAPTLPTTVTMLGGPPPTMQIENSTTAGVCMGLNAQKALVAVACQGGANSFWAIGKDDGEIRPQGSPNECLGINPNFLSPVNVRLDPCDPKKNAWQRWDVLPNGRIKNEAYNRCIAPADINNAKIGEPIAHNMCHLATSAWKPR